MKHIENQHVPGMCLKIKSLKQLIISRLQKYVNLLKVEHADIEHVPLCSRCSACKNGTPSAAKLANQRPDL